MDIQDETKKQDTPPVGGILPFPLDPNALFTLKNGGFILFGKATLASGTATILDRRIKASSIALVQYEVVAGTIGVALKAICSDGQVVFTSIDATSATKTADTSVVSYIVIL